MKSGRVATRYAKALLEFSFEKKVQKNVFEEIKNILSIMQKNVNLNDALNNPILPTKQKRKILSDIFNKSSSPVQRFFDLLSQNNREGMLANIAQKYIQLFNAKQGKTVASVTTAVALTKEMEIKLLKKASELSAFKIELKNIIDPKIKGGFVLRVGDLQYNASISDRIFNLKRELTTYLK